MTPANEPSGAREVGGSVDRPRRLVTTAILRSSVVGADELFARLGDTRAGDVISRHRTTVGEVLASHQGAEMRWHRSGVIGGFRSVASAVACAREMHLMSRVQVDGEYLALKIGLHVGDLVLDDPEIYSLPLVVATRLCEMARAGGTLCSDLVVKALAGNPDAKFVETGPQTLKGLPEPLSCFELEEGPDEFDGLRHDTPVIGRSREIKVLEAEVHRLHQGVGGIVTIAGEPGLGKTRLLEVTSEWARSSGVTVLWGSCPMGERPTPYGPFAEALDRYVADLDPADVLEAAGEAASVLAKLSPSIGGKVGGVEGTERLSGEEERYRTVSAVGGFLVALSRERPLVLVIDDVHWADTGTVSMLEHIARVVGQEAILLLLAYREDEIDSASGLGRLLEGFQGTRPHTRLQLRGLETDEVGDLISALAIQGIPRAAALRLAERTAGNPFFIRETLLHLVEAGIVFRGPDGKWTSNQDVKDMALPHTVKSVIQHRLERLSDATQTMLAAAAAFATGFELAVISRVTGLDEDILLDAIDEAIAIRVLEPGDHPDTYVLTHALFRSVLYDDLNPSRRLRLHRRIAEVLAEISAEHPQYVSDAEVAVHYHLSKELRGAEQGLEFALRAAENAGSTGAFEEEAHFLRMALDLLPSGVPKGDTTARLGLALIWSLAFDEAQETVRDGAELISAESGDQAARSYLATAALAFYSAGSSPHAWELAAEGLARGGPRDIDWALLTWLDYERRETSATDYAGLVVLRSPERVSAAKMLEAALEDRPELGGVVRFYAWGLHESRDEILAAGPDADRYIYWAGDYERGLALAARKAAEARRAGRLSQAAFAETSVARCLASMGRLDEARVALAAAADLIEKLPGIGWLNTAILGAQDSIALATDTDWDKLLAKLDPIARAPDPAMRWAVAAVVAGCARSHAHVGDHDVALEYVERVTVPISQVSIWAGNFIRVACDAAETLWLCDSPQGIEIIERTLRELVTGPDFRFPMVDGRLSLARLAALDRRFDESLAWLEQSREVLRGQRAETLLAITELDEARIRAARGGASDSRAAGEARARAIARFTDLRLTGWLERAQNLSL